MKFLRIWQTYYYKIIKIFQDGETFKKRIFVNYEEKKNFKVEFFSEVSLYMYMYISCIHICTYIHACTHTYIKQHQQQSHGLIYDSIFILLSLNISITLTIIGFLMRKLKVTTWVSQCDTSMKNQTDLFKGHGSLPLTKPVTSRRCPISQRYSQYLHLQMRIICSMHKFALF